MRPSWIVQARAVAVPTVADALGLSLDRNRRALRPCPGCGAEQRGSTDKRRGPVGLTPDRQGWRCFRCDAAGDALDLVAVRFHGSKLRDLTAEQRADVRAWYADRGWCDDNGTGRGTAPAPRPVPRPPEPEPLSRPDAGEVARLWEACVLVTEDADVAGWLAGRGFDPDRVAELDLARALPRGLDLPRWAWFKGKPWNRGPWRCLFPAWGPTGRMESLRARAAMQDIPPGDKAGAAAAGEGSATGLLLADAGGRVLLETGKAPTWWPEGQPLQVVVVEGETDFLSRATLYGDAAEDAPPVLGLWSGAWTDELARRIPDGAQVVIRTDNNPAGDRYAKRVCATLAGRCDLFRKSQPKGDP